MPEKPSFQVFCSFQWFVAQFGAIWAEVWSRLEVVPTWMRVGLPSAHSPHMGNSDAGSAEESLNVSWILKLIGPTSARHDYHDRSWQILAFRCPKNRPVWWKSEASGHPRSSHVNLPEVTPKKGSRPSTSPSPYPSSPRRVKTASTPRPGRAGGFPKCLRWPGRIWGLHSGGWGWRRCWGPRETGGWGSVSDVKGETSYHE